MFTLHTCKISSHSSKKSRPLWPVTMDDSAPTQERRKLVKTYENVLLENGLRLLRYAGRPTLKMIKRLSRKTTTNVKNNPTN